MPGLLLALVVLVPTMQAPQSPATTPELSSDTATRLVAAWPGLDASSGRRLISAKGGSGVVPGIGFIEFRFSDRKGIRTAVGLAAPSGALPAGRKALAEADGWALVQVLEDKTLDDVIDSLRRTRVSANESAALGDLRALVSGEQAYASSNGGLFDLPSCLTANATCLPPGPGRGLAYLPDGLAQLGERAGYRRRFARGAPGKPPAGVKVSPSSMLSFAVTAVPVKPGETGELGFCADDQGHVCTSPDGSEPPVAAGRCAFPCPSVAASASALRSPDARARAAAARALGKMAGASAAEPLSAALGAEADANARLEMVSALSDIGGPIARSALRQALKDSDSNVRFLAARSLAQGAPAPSVPEREELVAALLPLLDESLPRARSGAIDVLGDLGNPSARKAIEARLRDPDSDVRESARAALEKLSRSPAARALAGPVRPKAESPKAEAPWAPPPNAVRVGGKIKMPTRVSAVDPVYPPEAAAKGVSGTVILEALIGENGEITSSRVLRSVPGLDEAATHAVRQWVYEPTVVGGKPVPVIVTLTVSFKPGE
jgi:TonB family protein